MRFPTRPGLLALALYSIYLFATPGRAQTGAATAPLPGNIASASGVLAGPLPTGAVAKIPRTISLPRSAAIALLPPLLLWAMLALEHARRSDPNFIHRRARGKLRRRLARISATSAPTPADLENWCTLTADMWGVARVAPTYHDISNAIARFDAVPARDAWLSLWQEARRARFSERAQIGADWTMRARAAVEQTNFPRLTSLLPTRREHWVPRMAVAVALAWPLLATRASAADATALYQSGHYAAARALWLQDLNVHPSDWGAHNNVALTYAQQDAWGAAAAHWTAAYIQQPAQPVVAANLRNAVAKLGTVDPLLRQMLEPAGYDRLASRLSPAQWQDLVQFALAGIALGLGLQIVSLYIPRNVIWRPLGMTVALAALGLGAISEASVGRYGLLANAQAACVARSTDLRSIPSDLVEQQQTAPILPGTLVTITGSYFGWVRLGARDHILGWVRREAVLPLYQAVAPPEGGGLKVTPKR